MSFDIDKIPLTLLSNEAKIQNLYPEEQEDVEFFSQLEIDNRLWSTVSEYVYANLLPREFEKEFLETYPQKGYFIAYMDMIKRAMLKIISDALRLAYEKNVLNSNDNAATILMKTGNTNLVFESGFLENIFQGNDASLLVGKTLMNIREMLIRLKNEVQEKEKEEQLIPLLEKIYTAFLWLKFEIMENGTDIKHYEGKSLDDIVSSAANNYNNAKFQRPTYDLCRQVYRHISIPSKIIDEIKNDPDKLTLYNPYLKVVLSKSVFDELQEYVKFPEKYTNATLEEILCKPIPIEVIKIFSSDVNKLVPLVRKTYLRKGFDNFSSWKSNRIFEKIASNYVNKVAHSKTSEEKDKIIQDLIQKKGKELLQALETTKNKALKETISQYEKDLQPKILLSDVEDAESKSVTVVEKVEAMSDDVILSKILEEARMAAGVKFEKENEYAYNEQTTIAYSSMFSPFSTNGNEPFKFEDLQFPTIAHYVIYKLVSIFPNIKHEEKLSFYHTVILCTTSSGGGGDSNNKSQQEQPMYPKFIAFDRLEEIFKQLFRSIFFTNKKFYLENALAAKFFGSSDFSQKAIDVYDEISSQFPLLESSNKLDSELSELTVKWLNENRSLILYDRTQSNRRAVVEIQDLKHYSDSIFPWVVANMNDFIYAFYHFAAFFNNLSYSTTTNVNLFSPSEVDKLLALLDVFTTHVYYKNRIEVGLVATDLTMIQAPEEIDALFQPPYHVLDEKIKNQIYRTVICPIYYAVKIYKINLNTLQDSIIRGQKLLSSAANAETCYPCKIFENEDMKQQFEDFVDEPMRCPLTALINVIARIYSGLEFYNLKSVRWEEVVKLAAQIIFNRDFHDVSVVPEDFAGQLQFMDTLVKHCFPEINDPDMTALQIYLMIMKISKTYFENSSYYINRTNYFLID